MFLIIFLLVIAKSLSLLVCALFFLIVKVFYYVQLRYITCSFYYARDFNGCTVKKKERTRRTSPSSFPPPASPFRSRRIYDAGIKKQWPFRLSAREIEWPDKWLLPEINKRCGFCERMRKNGRCGKADSLLLRHR